MKSSPMAPALFAVVFVAVQVAVPLARLELDRTGPFSSRYSWSMGADPMPPLCAVRVRDARAQRLAIPPELEGHPATWLMMHNQTLSAVRTSLIRFHNDEPADWIESALDVLRRYKKVAQRGEPETWVADFECAMLKGPPHLESRSF
jgi:hypothetical protein